MSQSSLALSPGEAPSQQRSLGPAVSSRTFQFPFCLLRQHPFHLSLGRPDVLDKAVALGQAVQGIVGLTHGADEAAEGVDVVLAGDSTAGLVHLGDGDLNRSVVLGLDDAVGGRALAGDVAVRKRGWVSTGQDSTSCALSLLSVAIFAQPFNLRAPP